MDSVWLALAGVVVGCFVVGVVAWFLGRPFRRQIAEERNAERTAGTAEHRTR